LTSAPCVVNNYRVMIGQSLHDRLLFDVDGYRKYYPDDPVKCLPLEAIVTTIPEHQGLVVESNFSQDNRQNTALFAAYLATRVDEHVSISYPDDPQLIDVTLRVNAAVIAPGIATDGRAIDQEAIGTVFSHIVTPDNIHPDRQLIIGTAAVSILRIPQS
jgi:hypothetical protein